MSLIERVKVKLGVSVDGGKIVVRCVEEARVTEKLDLILTYEFAIYPFVHSLCMFVSFFRNYLSSY